MKSLLELKNITYFYEGNQEPALQDFSMKIPKGKKCVILGQNGSGKSTIFQLGNGLLVPKKGSILWKDEPLVFKKKNLMEHRKRTGLLFQNADEMLLAPIVIEDLAYGLINAGFTGEGLKQKLEQIVHQYNLEAIADRPIHHLSLGEKRRVALAGIMGLQPELLMLDEPTTYLDPLQTRTFLKQLHEIHNNGTTVVMTTHDLELAYEWADRIFVMYKGQLVYEGRPDELFSNEPFVLEMGLTVPLLFQFRKARWR